jgi:hypothetical protein
LTNLSEDHDWEQDMHKVLDANRNLLKHCTIDDDALFAALLDLSISTTRKKTHGGIFWNFSRLLCNLIYRNTPIERIEDVQVWAHDVDGISGLWSTMFLRAGYNGFVDYGDGIIHVNEPIQAVFLNPRAMTVVDRLPNPRYGEDDAIVISDPKSFNVVASKILSSQGDVSEPVASFIKQTLKALRGSTDDHVIYLNWSPNPNRKITVRFGDISALRPNGLDRSVLKQLLYMLNSIPESRATDLAPTLARDIFYIVDEDFIMAELEDSEPEMKFRQIVRDMLDLLIASLRGKMSDVIAELEEMATKVGYEKVVDNLVELYTL